MYILPLQVENGEVLKCWKLEALMVRLEFKVIWKRFQCDYDGIPEFMINFQYAFGGGETSK